MAAKICAIEIHSQGYICWVVVPNWRDPKGSAVSPERNDAFFFPSKREAALFSKLLKKQCKPLPYTFKIFLDDLPF